MSDARLSILNYALLALVYLFFARVLWAVWSEVRGPQAQATSLAQRSGGATTAMPAPPRGRGRRGVPQRLLVLEPKVRKGAAYPVATDLTLGRAATCAIGLPDDTYASQIHARVFRRDGGLWVEDLGSTNGTYVNGVKVSDSQQLVIGDRLQVGSTIFEIG